ncbi:DnaA/Hda family protein [Aureliella helgolandensis]|uniref:Chromosomal replication initiator protein DnaA n=1 Tax=Aureliella helgolandensis TaxID=2527968 RepID=A0A518G9Z7_9BACT|nr:DnaA/Hda family protein [Aureliella helgolandensis]QDV25393.1 Chromosomal replication initiator protein DnaA [Aureliella helgolandensis]
MASEVNQSERNIADQLRSALVDRISPERFDLWIPAETTWTWTGDVLQLGFPSDFTRQLAMKMLLKDMTAGLVELAGEHTSIDSIVVVPERKAADPPDAASAERPALKIHAADSDARTPEREPFETPGQPERSALSQGVAGGYAQATGGGSGSSSGGQVAPSQPVSNQPTSGQPTGRTGQPRIENLWNKFVRGESNQLAWTTANLVINDPGRLTPVLLHGPSGSGKSCLLEAVAQQLRIVRRMRRVVHMTSEQFTNDFMEGLRGGGLPMFRRKYRDVEAFILDDIQFFVGKKSTLTEVKHTLDNLLRLNKQVVFTANCSLNELSGLGNDLIGRLRGGLVSPLFPLDEATRGGLLSRLLSDAGVEVAEGVVVRLAERAAGDGRVLSGIAKRLMAVASAHDGTLNWDQSWNAVYDLVQATQPIVRIGDIERVVCSVFGLASDSLQSTSKMRSVSQPRMLAMFLARKYTPAAYKEIGEYFGKRRHSTVISAEKTVTGWLSERDDVPCGRGMSVKDALRHVESQLQVG